MDVVVRRIDDKYLFEGKGDRPGTLLMDNSASDGGIGEAPSPLQAYLMSIGGCAGIDIVSILNKSKQEISDFEIEIHADRYKHGFISPIEHVNLHFKLDGKIDESKAARAVKLTLDKYCTVSFMMREAARITASLSVNGGPKKEVYSSNQEAL